MAFTESGSRSGPQDRGGIGGFITRIGDDVKTLAHDEVELAREEAYGVVRESAGKAAALAIGSFFAVIGLAMLCVTAVVALDAVIDSLAIRMLIMTAVYIALGGVLALVAIRQLSHTLRNPMTRPAEQAKRTALAVKSAVTRGGEHHA